MADGVEKQSETEDVLAALLEDEEDEDDETEEAGAKYQKQDEKLAKKVRVLSEIVTRNERQKQGEKIYEEFMANASDTAKEIYAVLADDDMSPSQTQRVVDAANRKAKAIDEKLATNDTEKSGEEGEKVEALAAKMAAERWGAGPIRTDKSKPDEDEEAKLMERIAKGDVNALVESIIGDNVPW